MLIVAQLTISSPLLTYHMDHVKHLQLADKEDILQQQELWLHNPLKQFLLMFVQCSMRPIGSKFILRHNAHGLTASYVMLRGTSLADRAAAAVEYSVRPAKMNAWLD